MSTTSENPYWCLYASFYVSPICRYVRNLACMGLSHRTYIRTRINKTSSSIPRNDGIRICSGSTNSSSAATATATSIFTGKPQKFNNSEQTRLKGHPQELTALNTLTLNPPPRLARKCADASCSKVDPVPGKCRA